MVCSDGELFHEVCGDSAQFCDPYSAEALAKAISEVLTSPARAADLRERSLSRARTFTWEATAQQTLALYRQVLEGEP